MAVFFKTGENTAASVSWPVYFFLVLPMQAVWLFVKALVYLYAAVAVVVVFVCTWTYQRWRDHKESRPPA